MCNPSISSLATALSLWHFVIGTFSVSLTVRVFGISLGSLSSPTLRLYILGRAHSVPHLRGGQETRSQATEA